MLACGAAPLRNGDGVCDGAEAMNSVPPTPACLAPPSEKFQSKAGSLGEGRGHILVQPREDLETLIRPAA